jgi:hypothetical protein
MIVAIHGSRSFSDYNIFLRAMHTALTQLPEDDKMITIMSAGPAQINSFGQEFSNITERSLKARGIRIKLVKIPPSWIKDNISNVDYLAYFSKPKESLPDIVTLADSKDVEVGVYRF